MKIVNVRKKQDTEKENLKNNLILSEIITRLCVSINEYALVSAQNRWE